ncbi:acetolactate synthase large subunit [Acetivibrio straminisolvens JCM 21531]|uniref:Acetolactate synthase large subunit n=1 Tax=Acetivibrio straminisolvens JCM 21531 TaxID=1294263 RepID=W4VC31_9FIRM|nr:acetolactate synthase large subunit [Acetivibrio straminisolvens JCM 21531]
MKLSGAQAIVKALELEGVEVVFGYPGAAICPFYDALMESNIKHILTRHEQGAAHAASGYARTTEESVYVLLHRDLERPTLLQVLPMRIWIQPLWWLLPGRLTRS